MWQFEEKYIQGMWHCGEKRNTQMGLEWSERLRTLQIEDDRRTDICVLQCPLAEGIRNIRPRIQVLGYAETTVPCECGGVQKCAPTRFLPSSLSLCLWPGAICSSPNCRDTVPEASLSQQTLLRIPLPFPLNYKRYISLNTYKQSCMLAQTHTHVT